MTANPPSPVSVAEFDPLSEAPSGISLGFLTRSNRYPDYKEVGKTSIVITGQKRAVLFKVSGTSYQLKASI
jgi:hypothetical protein